MKEIVNIKDAKTNIYLGFVYANEKGEVPEKEFVSFIDRARRLFGQKVGLFLRLRATREIMIVRENKKARNITIKEPLEFDSRQERYVNTFWKGIKGERAIS